MFRLVAEQQQSGPDVLKDVFWLVATATGASSYGCLELVADVADGYDGAVDRLQKSNGRRVDERTAAELSAVLRQRNEHDRRRRRRFAVLLPGNCDPHRRRLIHRALRRGRPVATEYYH